MIISSFRRTFSMLWHCQRNSWLGDSGWAETEADGNEMMQQNSEGIFAHHSLQFYTKPVSEESPTGQLLWMELAAPLDPRCASSIVLQRPRGVSQVKTRHFLSHRLNSLSSPNTSTSQRVSWEKSSFVTTTKRPGSERLQDRIFDCPPLKASRW